MVVVQVTHRVHPEHVDQYRQATLANAAASRQEPGNLRFDLLQDVNDPCAFQIYEAYADRAAQQAHLASPHFAAWRDAVAGVFVGRSVAKFVGLSVPQT